MIIILYAGRGNVSREKYSVNQNFYSPEDFDEAMRFLQHGLDYSEFRDFLPVARQTSITPVIGKNFDMLRDLLISHGNILPDYVLEAEASPLPYAAPNRTSPHSLKGTAILIRCSRITAQNLHFLTKNYTLKKLFSSTHRVFSSSACMTKF